MRKTWKKSAILWAAATTTMTLLIGGVFSACESPNSVAPTPYTTTPTTPLSAYPPGTKLFSTGAAPAWKKMLPPGSGATYIRYRSTSGIDGSATGVNGVVLTPGGPAPKEGWPIVTVGHGLTAVQGDCGPVRRPELASVTARIPVLVKAGYVVVMSDYQGISASGVHPFLDPATMAHNLIDAVAAARQLIPQHSNRWAALGHSQGGHAVWATMEHAKEFGNAFQFVGAVVLAPAVLGASYFDAALSEKLTLQQESLFPSMVWGYLARHPDEKWEDFLSGSLLEHKDMFTSCVGVDAAERQAVVQKITPSDAIPRTEEATHKMEEWLKEVSLPHGKGDGPLLVVQGAQDNLILPEWVHTAVQRGCELGMTVKEVIRPGQDHGHLEDDAEMVSWLKARFAGDKPVPTSCE